MKIYKAILVDDEHSALQNLKNKIEKVSDQIEVIAVFQDPKIAVKSINKLVPDILFTDIQMPGLNGFELINNH